MRSGYDPDAISDVGQHEMCYSLYPHPGDWRAAGVVREAAGFNQPLLARTVTAAEPMTSALWLPELSGSPAVVPACLKPASDGSGRILRLYESTGQTAEVAVGGFPPGCRVWETTVAEDKLAELHIVDGRVRLTFRPWQVMTLLAEE